MHVVHAHLAHVGFYKSKSLRLDISMGSGRLSLGLGLGLGSMDEEEDLEYHRLGDEEDQPGEYLDDFDLLESDPLDRPHQAWWWIRAVVIGTALLAISGAAYRWVAPFLLDKVIIPLMMWEARTFSKPILALVIFLSLSFFPTFLCPSGPSMWLTGIVFGYRLGFLIIMVGTTVGQTLPYFIGHWLLHDRIQVFLERWPKKAALLRLAEQGGWFERFRTIGLLRVSPIPYPWFNYAITATNIEYGPYIIGSMVGMIPEAFITIYSGRFLSTMADAQSKKRPLTPLEIAFNSIGFIIAVSVALAGAVYGRRALQDLELQEAAEHSVNQPLADVVAHSPVSSPLRR